MGTKIAAVISMILTAISPRAISTPRRVEYAHEVIAVSMSVTDCPPVIPQPILVVFREIKRHWHNPRCQDVRASTRTRKTWHGSTWTGGRVRDGACYMWETPKHDITGLANTTIIFSRVKVINDASFLTDHY
jgi:hypothetical protein